MDDFRCELLSDAQLAALAESPMPSFASPPRRSWHRDLYFDTSDDALRRRGVICRLRLSSDERHIMSLSLPNMRAAAGNGRPVRVDAIVRDEDPRSLLAGNSAPVRRLRSLLDPAALETRVDVEVERMTRRGFPDWLRRPTIELHYDRCTVRRNGDVHAFRHVCGHRLRGRGDELARVLRIFEHDHGLRLTTASPRENAEVSLRWLRPRDRAATEDGLRVFRDAQLTHASGPENASSDLDPELSLLAFQLRVLAMAEDPATPLAERLRFLAIVSANLDEFYMVRMSALRLDARGGDRDAEVRLAAARADSEEIIQRQEACFRSLLPLLAAQRVRILAWRDLSEGQRLRLSDEFRQTLWPELTPMAMTLSPGHPVPHLPHLSLSLAVVFRTPDRGRPHFAELELPNDSPRFIRVDSSESAYDVIPLEELIRGNLDMLYPVGSVDHAHLFRVTRGGALDVDEMNADDLIDAVAEASDRRRFSAAVRMEVERGMPQVVRELVLENLRRERGADEAPLSLGEVSESDIPLDLRSLTQLPLPPEPTLSFPPLDARDPFADAPSLFDEIRLGDRLVHHPFERFDSTVLRFLRDAAADPNVIAIKMTLYRVGDRSPVVDALLDAARSGKSVAVFVELKARFDEDVNVSSARALEDAGARVVRGLVGLKNHAKVALVVRREDGKARRYVHVGTGNYSVRSGAQYTDLSLFSTHDDLTADVADLFNELTGTSRPPERLTRGALVAPQQMLPTLLEHIAHEAACARAGKPARITAKINGLSDEEVVRALYEASCDGVEIDLIVRGICTLRPGVPGLSERIRVVSIVGRFLEHSRIYRFSNGGEPRYYIGSADLRPRNLRRRVELLVPVRSADHRGRLDEILAQYVADATAWELRPTGEYVKRAGEIGAQRHFALKPA